MKCDILVVGGGCGGVAAAMAAASMGLKVVMSEEFSWLGGQLTSQLVPPDEHQWIETHGATARYRRFRDRVRNLYRTELPVTNEAFADSVLNPGGGWVSRLCFEPRIGWMALMQMLLPAISTGGLQLIERSIPISADVDHDEITAVTFRHVETQSITHVTAKFVLDATELGDLLHLAGVEHVTGAESQAETGEPHALVGPANPRMMQGLTWCAALAHDEGSHRVIDRPADYARWRDLKPANWPTKLFDFEIINPITGSRRTLPLFGKDSSDWANLFSYRQIRRSSVYIGPETSGTILSQAFFPPLGPGPEIDPATRQKRSEMGSAGLGKPAEEVPSGADMGALSGSNSGGLGGDEVSSNRAGSAGIAKGSDGGSARSDLSFIPAARPLRPDPATIVNWPQNDYYLKPIIGVPDYEKQLALAESRAQTMSLIYWLQTEAPRHDGGVGYPGLYLVPELAGTEDGLAQAPYIRESRRIRSLLTITEPMVSPGENPGARLARPMPCPVGIGHYRMDLHPCTDEGPTLDLDALPFQIPLGALIPVRVRNLIAAGKNIGTTHITNGCYRLHPVEWNIGESAGLLAAYCVLTGVRPVEVWESGLGSGVFSGMNASESSFTVGPEIEKGSPSNAESPEPDSSTLTCAGKGNSVRHSGQGRVNHYAAFAALLHAHGIETTWPA